MWKFSEPCKTFLSVDSAVHRCGKGVVDQRCIAQGEACVAPPGLSLVSQMVPSADPSLRSGQARWAKLCRPYGTRGNTQLAHCGKEMWVSLPLMGASVAQALLPVLSDAASRTQAQPRVAVLLN